jgi:heme-degrading monooxygenase HmoA
VIGHGFANEAPRSPIGRGPPREPPSFAATRGPTSDRESVAFLSGGDLAPSAQGGARAITGTKGGDDVCRYFCRPKSERWDDYPALAKQLKPRLEAVDGFIDNERFKSMRDERRMFSLSTWRDEKALIRGRAHGEHHGVQKKGRFEIFADYQLRVGEIISDTTNPPSVLTITEVVCTDPGTALGDPPRVAHGRGIVAVVAPDSLEHRWSALVPVQA